MDFSKIVTVTSSTFVDEWELPMGGHTKKVVHEGVDADGQRWQFASWETTLAEDGSVVMQYGEFKKLS